LRPAIVETKVRSKARARLPGVGSEASTVESSVVVGKLALAWAMRKDQSRLISLTWVGVSPMLPRYVAA